jgi:hypothetical protein
VSCKHEENMVMGLESGYVNGRIGHETVFEVSRNRRVKSRSERRYPCMPRIFLDMKVAVVFGRRTSLHVIDD